jgi:Protein of unknown function (DUF3892)
MNIAWWHRLSAPTGTNSDGSGWWMTLESAIAMVESKRFSLYVLDTTPPTPTPIPIVVDVSPLGNKFLRTEFDGKPTNNLLALPECPGHP